jgi:hypothetical protein
VLYSVISALLNPQVFFFFYPTDKKKYVVNKSPFVFKKAKEIYFVEITKVLLTFPLKSKNNSNFFSIYVMNFFWFVLRDLDGFK